MGQFLKYAARYFSFAVIACSAGFIYAAYVITNTGFFIVISSFLFGLSIVLPVLGYLNLRNLSVRRDSCSLCSVGDEISVSLEMENSGPWPAFWVMAGDPLGAFCSERTPFTASAEMIPARSSVSASAVMRAEKRGLHSLGSLSAASCFPLALFFYERRYPVSDRIMILPSAMPFRFVPFLSRERSAARGRVFRSRSEDREFAGLRDHVPSDGMRMVCWAKSASAGKLVVREFAAGRGVRAAVAVDGTGASPLAFEDMVSAAAGIFSFCGKKSIKCAFLEPPKDPGGVARVLEGTWEDGMKRLALLSPAPVAAFPEEELRRNGTTAVFIFTANPSFDFRGVESFFREARINCRISLFDSSSYGDKRDRSYAAGIKGLKKSGMPVFSKGDSPEGLFASNG